MKKLCLKVASIISLFVFVGVTIAFAGGFQIYQAAAPDAMALGAATVGRDDLVSNAWYNPAAIMDFKETRYNSGYSLAKINWEYEPGNGLQKLKVKDKIQIVPGSHLIHPINEKYTAAFSFYTPFGLGMKWNDDDIRRLIDSGLYNDPAGSPPGMLVSKAVPTTADLKVPYFNTTVATRLSDKFSVAGGLSFMKADFKLRFLSRGVVLPATVAWDNFVEYRADGWGLGYVLAGHYNTGKDWKFGVRYLSNADVKMRGTVESHPTAGNTYMKGTLKLPSTLTVGFVNSSIERWQLSCDIMRTEWSRFDQLKIDPRYAWQSADGGFTAPKNWKNTLSYRFGAEYKYCEHWTLRGGYVYDNSPIPDETRNFELPGTDGHIFSLGASRTTNKYVFDIGYSFMLLEKGKAGTIPLNGVGEFTGANNHFLMFSYTMNL